MASPVPEMTASEALRVRLRSLVLAGGPRDVGRSTAVGLARWFGAMQAQDIASLQWSLGLRLGGAIADVDAELERGDVLRTWPMRGTLHLVPAEDAAWMVRILGERPLAGAVKRRAYLGLSETDANRAVELLADALAGGGRLTRAQCIEVLETGGIEAAGQIGYHLLWFASQNGVTCIAPNVEGEQTFVLLDEWVRQCCGEPRALSRDQALAEMALRYFQSHGPARRKDFAGWAGVTATDAKRAIAAAGSALTVVRVDGAEMVHTSEALDAVGSGGVDDERQPDGWVAVAGFDEYLLGYKDRSLMVDPGHMAAIIPGGNGVFRSTLVREGRVMASWKRTLTQKAVKVEVTPIVRVSKADRTRAEEALQAYAAFVSRDLVATWV